jgi:hypothetical protein
MLQLLMAAPLFGGNGNCEVRNSIRSRGTTRRGRPRDGRVGVLAGPFLAEDKRHRLEEYLEIEGEWVVAHIFQIVLHLLVVC